MRGICYHCHHCAKVEDRWRNAFQYSATQRRHQALAWAHLWDSMDPSSMEADVGLWCVEPEPPSGSHPGWQRHVTRWPKSISNILCFWKSSLACYPEVTYNQGVDLNLRGCPSISKGLIGMYAKWLFYKEETWAILCTGNVGISQLQDRASARATLQTSRPRLRSQKCSAKILSQMQSVFGLGPSNTDCLCSPKEKVTRSIICSHSCNFVCAHVCRSIQSCHCILCSVYDYYILLHLFEHVSMVELNSNGNFHGNFHHSCGANVCLVSHFIIRAQKATCPKSRILVGDRARIWRLLSLSAIFLSFLLISC